MCKQILTFVGIILWILTLVYLFKVYGETKVDLFQQPFETGEKEKFFIDSTQNPDQLPNVNAQCKDYQAQIMNPNTKKLGDVFILNTESVHRGVFYYLIITITFIIILVMFLILFIVIALSPESSSLRTIASFILLIISLFSMILLILSIINFILLLYSYYSGDTTTYYEFLRCKNVNYEGFHRYRIVEILKSDFRTFIQIIVFNFIINFIKEFKKEVNNQLNNQ